MMNEQDRNLSELLGFNPDTRERTESRGNLAPASHRIPSEIQQLFKAKKEEGKRVLGNTKVRYETEKLLVIHKSGNGKTLREYCDYDLSTSASAQEFPTSKSATFEWKENKWLPVGIDYDNEMGSITEDSISFSLEKTGAFLYLSQKKPYRNFTVTYNDNRLTSVQMNLTSYDHSKCTREDINGISKMKKGESLLIVPTEIDATRLMDIVFDDPLLLDDPYYAPSECDESWKNINVFELFQATWNP